MLTTIFSTLLLLGSAAIIDKASTQSGWPASSSGNSRTNWTGNWTGVVQTYPKTPSNSWDIAWEIGEYPATDNTCTTWLSVFSSNGSAVGMKDYRFCRGKGPEDLYIDEGGGVNIGVRWIDDVMVSPFKVQRAVFGLSTMRMRGDVLEQELTMTDDRPAQEGVVVSVRPQNIQRFTMRRA